MNSSHLEPPTSSNYSFSPKELEHKNRREEYYRQANDPNAPLGTRSKAWFSAFTEGAQELMEGAKREYSKNDKKQDENKPDHDDSMERSSESNTNNNGDTIYDNDANRNEHHYRTQRQQLWEQAADGHLTLARRTKAGTGAFVAGARELFEGGKKEFENKKKERNNKKNENKERMQEEPNNSVPNTTETPKKDPPTNPDDEMPEFPDVPETNHETRKSKADAPVECPPAYEEACNQNHSTHPEGTTINLDKDDVMKDFHLNKETEYMRQRRQQTSVARDTTLPLSERMKAGGSAFISATKEMSEGCRREFRDKNKKENTQY